MDRRQIRPAAMVAAAVVGLLFGLGVGLLITRLTVAPGRAGSGFANLGDAARAKYALLVAARYAHDGDLAQARAHPEDLWAAGYCQCCEPDITRERCRELYDAGQCLGISHYSWRVEFRRSW